MLKLNSDVLFSIFEELQYRNSLYSCLLVNKTWCRAILWKDLWGKYPMRIINYNEKEKVLFNAIISNLSDEAREKLRSQGIDLSIQQKPSYNYISFCRYLNLSYLKQIINDKEFKISTISDEILKLFINNNTRFIEHKYF